MAKDEAEAWWEGRGGELWRPSVPPFCPRPIGGGGGIRPIEELCGECGEEYSPLLLAVGIGGGSGGERWAELWELLGGTPKDEGDEEKEATVVCSVEDGGGVVTLCCCCGSSSGGALLWLLS